jgi:hypothetical protein
MKQGLFTIVLLVGMVSGGCGSLLSALAGPPPPSAPGVAVAVESSQQTADRAAARLEALSARIETVAKVADGAATAASGNPGVGGALGISGLVAGLVAYAAHQMAEGIKSRYGTPVTK